MNPDPASSFNPSRRQFVATSGAALAAAILPTSTATAQAVVKYRRVKMTSGQAPLDSYREAISRMLTLPPSDPRNWYRNALVHTLDCPHGNWWFLPWHRGYIGWFEEICRDLSNNPNFALPYWDWTEYPRIPDAYYDGLLTPLNAAFIDSLEKFEAQFRDPVSDLWNSFNSDQLAQLKVRAYTDTDTYNTPEDLWKSIRGAPPGLPSMFYPRAQARTLTKASPCFDPATRMAVSAATVRTAMAAPDFISFGSEKVAQHSLSGAQSILESQPHNLVHNSVGGFMSDFLSPVDPIFFMHHANIDRLWDVWTRRQAALGLPSLPPDSDLDAWRNEPFLFFRDGKGNPVTEKTCGDYVGIGDFAYDYQPGSGDEPPVKPSTFAKKIWSASILEKSVAQRQSVQAEVELPEALPPSTGQPDGASMFARITLKPGVETKDIQFHVLVNPPAGATQVSFDDPSFAGTFSAFGRRASAGHADQPLTFTISLTEAVRRLVAAKQLDPADKINVQVVAVRRGVALSPLDISAAEITLGAY